MTAKTKSLLPKIEAALRKDVKLQTDTILDVSVSRSGGRENIHVLVISRVLDEMTEQEKQEYLWSLLDQAVKDKKLKKQDISKVTLILPLSVEELKR